MIIKGSIRKQVMAPEISLAIEGGSGIIGIEGSADLPEKRI